MPVQARDHPAQLHSSDRPPGSSRTRRAPSGGHRRRAAGPALGCDRTDLDAPARRGAGLQPPGTLFILIVVSGFGAAAGYAFAARRIPATSRARRWWHRLLAYVPFLGMGPFVIFFLGHFAYAWRASRPGARRLLRIPLGVVAVLVPAFWTFVFITQRPQDLGWASAVLYLALGYLIYVALRFALEPAEDAPVRPPPAALA